MKERSRFRPVRARGFLTSAFLFFLPICFAPVTTHAATESLELKSDSRVWKSDSDLSLRSFSYFSSYDDGGDPRFYDMELAGRLRGTSRTGTSEYRWDFFGGIRPTAKNLFQYGSFFWAVPEISAGWKFSNALGGKQSFTAGRKRHSWSRLDDQWELGLVQPLYRRDYFTPISQGMAGFWVDHESDLVRATFFISPLFLPEQGTAFEFEDGQCFSYSAWFQCPAQTAQFGDDFLDIKYDLRIPDLTRILFKPSIGSSVSIGDEKLFGQLSYVYKPSNRLSVGYQIPDDSVSIEDSSAIVQIDPRVTYLHQVAADFVYRPEPFEISMSGLAEAPEAQSVPDTLNTHIFRNALLASPSVAAQLPSLGFLKTRLSLSYLHRWGGNEDYVGPFLPDEVRPFERRHPFRSAYAWGIDSRLFSNWGMNFLLKSDLDSSASVLDFGLSYLWSGIRFQGRASFLSMNVETAEQAAQEGDWIGRFRANDRVEFGVGYVF